MAKDRKAPIACEIAKSIALYICRQVQIAARQNIDPFVDKLHSCRAIAPTRISTTLSVRSKRYARVERMDLKIATCSGKQDLCAMSDKRPRSKQSIRVLGLGPYRPADARARNLVASHQDSRLQQSYAYAISAPTLSGSPKRYI